MFLSLCGLLLIPMFTVTGVVVRLFHEKEKGIAEDWRAAGETNLAGGQAKEAIEDFRNALRYAPESTWLQLELAKALAETGQLDEAQNYLFRLRTQDPENSLINVELARVAVKRGDIDSATNYYHDAMYGHWPEEPHDHRLAARTELIEVLLKTDRKGAARAESLSMAVDNPAEPEVRVRAGDFLLQADDAQSAIREYQRALHLDPGSIAARTGLGKAYLELGKFPEAERYLAEAIRRGARGRGIARERGIAEAAAGLDPFAPNLGNEERRRRVLMIFEAAEKKAKRCLPGIYGAAASVPDNLRELAGLRAALPKRVGAADLAKHSELEAKMLDWALKAEQVARIQCGPEDAMEEAIALIAAKHKES